MTHPYDDIPLGVCILKRERKNISILYTNDALLRMIGKTSADALINRPFQDIWPHKDAALLVKSLRSPTPATSWVLPLTSKDKAQKSWVHMDIHESQWKTSEAEDEECYILWCSDISANKEKEKSLLAEVKKADEAAEMKSNFLATMSHEIRTPMQTIYGLLELILDEKPEGNISSMARIAQGAASGLLEILDDILDLAKMDANKMELDVFEVPVRTLVRGILEAMAVKVHGVSIELTDDIEKEVPFVIIGDPKRLRQILMNLIGNALKFTKEGTVTARVSRDTQHLTLPKNRIGLRFEIIDTGIGMSEEVCGRLFQSFAQADNSTSRKFGGTGLGLSISKKLVTLMGGEIGVNSVEGKGSTFWFEIPTEEVSTDSNTIDLPCLDGISVLSVEDHPQGAKEIVNSMRSMGATIESCKTYAEGLELVRRRPFDVGIIDQGLPDGLGLDLIKDIVDIRPRMGLIMYTVRDDTGLAHSLQALGVKYLTKPASRAGLGEAVNEASSKVAHMNIDGPTGLLIAEDTDSVRDILKRQLDKLGVQADFVHNGKEALEALKTGLYGILITDLHMPEMDGYELVETMRAREKETPDQSPLPIIALTADVQMSKRETYLRHGFDECLLKPVSLGQFKRLLIRWGLLNEELIQKSKDQKNLDEKEETSSAIDKKAMREQMGALDEGAIEMLHMFVDMTAPLVEAIQAAQDQKDLHALAETAHSLKGAARSACCNALGQVASDLQEMAENKNFSEDLVKKIATEFQRVREEITSLKPDTTH